ncbi:MAG: 6-phosphofructokinase, partial [Candidatus Omnitrophica bacterium]|nr:6-phosphofructokinase [Candidatus Omnitrophota bacterium]
YLLDMLDGGYKTGAMISIQAEKIVPIPFDEILNPETGRTTVRKLDITSDLYNTARKMMIRIEKEDFENQSKLANIARVAKMSVDEFRDKYGSIIK